MPEGSQPERLAFIGGGNMAQALLGGMAARGQLSAPPLVVEPNGALHAGLVERFGAEVMNAPGAPLKEATGLVLAVKPQQMEGALKAAAPHLSAPLVVSIAAGVRCASIARWLARPGAPLPIVRAMPNTPALVGAGMTGLYAGPEVDGAARTRAEGWLAAVGATLWVERESDLDAVTAVSGSGPAYVFFFIEALETAARAVGLSEEAARLLARQTVLGAAQLASSAPESAATLRERVTSKGGTTEAALRVLGEHGWDQAVVAAVAAATQRAAALGASG